MCFIFGFEVVECFIAGYNHNDFVNVYGANDIYLIVQFCILYYWFLLKFFRQPGGNEFF